MFDADTFIGRNNIHCKNTFATRMQSHGHGSNSDEKHRSLRGYGKKISIICFAWDNWGPLWKMTQQLMYFLSKKERVGEIIYINQDLYLVKILNSIKTELSSKQSRNKWKKALFQQTESPEDKIKVYTPLHYFPFSYRVGFLKKFDRKVVLHNIRKLCKKLSNRDLVLFINRKIEPSLIDHLKDAELKCFYWSDEWSSFPIGTKRIGDITVKEKEQSDKIIREILKRSNIVFTISEGLREKAKPFVPESYWLPCGTNYNNFYRATVQDTVIATEIINLPKPIIGLVGFISSSIDFNLLISTALAKPNWSFVIIGPKLPAAAWGEEFFKLKNVHYLGPKPYFELPKYIKAFDVCIIPYLKDESLQMADSNKLYDYLATGKPIVVSQNTAGLGKFSDLIRISDDENDFILKIEESLKENNPFLMRKRQETAKENSWEKRANFVWEKIVELLT